MKVAINQKPVPTIDVSYSSDIATALSYKDGIANTATLTNKSTHIAAYDAVINNGTAAPAGTSSWFLPSIGQWNLIVQGLATKKAGSPVTTDLGLNGGRSSNDNYKATNLNSVIEAAGGTGFRTDKQYWSSTQYSDWLVWNMKFDYGDIEEFVFHNISIARSVLAF